jgi:hypothetical protein
MEGKDKNYREVWLSGVSCYADAAIFDVSSEQVYLVSFFGRPGVVRAIGAAILQGIHVRLGRTSVRKPFMGSMRSLTQNLGGGLCHKIVLCPDYFAGSSLLTGRILVGADKKRAFQFLDSIVSTPLKAEWADTLWEKVFEPKHLMGFGFLDGKELTEAYLVQVTKSQEEVDELVLEGLKTGELN